MEDCKVNYDMTVRNAAGVIIQYLYGEDGMDACKIESQTIPYIDMDLDAIKATYGLADGYKDFKLFVNDDIFKALKAQKSTFEERMKSHYEQIMEDRDHVIIKINKNAYESSVQYPVALSRILITMQNTYSKYGANVPHDLDPNYILDKIDSLSAELTVAKHCPANMLFSMLLRAYLTPKRILINHRLTKAGFDTVIEQIKFRFYEAMVHPSEMVGVIAAQSIGEPSTQLVLNSIAYDTELLVNKAGFLERMQIGKFIDDYIQATPVDKIENHPDDTKLAYTTEDIKILSCDEDGKVSWKAIEAVTRHPVINEDGTNTVLKVTLMSGRSVTATKAKSFLKRIDNKIKPVEGKDLKVGDYLPVSKVLPTIKDNNVVELKSLDVSRYNFPGTTDTSKIPEHMPLDDEFGFFVGAYLAEGCVCSSSSNPDVNQLHVLIANIANIDKKFNERIFKFANKYGIGYHVDDAYNAYNELSMTVRLHSSVMASMMEAMCGNGSLNKRIPEFVLQAPDDFVKGVIDGYFSGDGQFHKKINEISAFSSSKGLLEDFQQVLTRFGIMSNIEFKSLQTMREKKPEAEILDGWQLYIKHENTQKFCNTFSITLDYKQDCLSYFGQATFKSSDKDKHMFNVVPNVKLSVGEIDVDTYGLDALIKKTTNPHDKKVLEDIMSEDIIYDSIVSIEEIANPTPYVYDLTVADTRTFNIYNNIACYDTFHSSGISSASKAVRGVPRLNELLAVSKNIKTPEMQIFVHPEVARNKLECMDIMNNIRTIKFKDIIVNSKIYYDPDEKDSTIIEDREFIKSYLALSDGDDEPVNSPWVLRLELDRDQMLNFKLDMITLHYTLENFYGDRVSVIFSDDNAEKLVLRVRIVPDDEKDIDKDDILTNLKALEHNIIESVPIRGVKSIHRVALQDHKSRAYNNTSKLFDEKHEWMIYTEGSNLRDVLALSFVDGYRSLTNDINEIYEVLGVEAARQALYNEIVEVLDTVKVNYRHIALLVDVMTNRGNILAVNRHGINRGDIGPLAKCSFEETTDKLIKAGVYSEYDNIKGVSANVMLGQIAPCGTGDVTVIMDNYLVNQMVEKSSVTVHNFVMDDEEACAPEVMKIDMPAPIPVQNVERKIDNEIEFV